eukprot:c5675_g1_i1.p1 GENE.c5675_g1_i1~~c5675_g1_i1.p1  ORF type:complete len:484 (+),score=100.67 c5675_g1_i1:26-1453(+)
MADESDDRVANEARAAVATLTAALDAGDRAVLDEALWNGASVAGAALAKLFGIVNESAGDESVRRQVSMLCAVNAGPTLVRMAHVSHAGQDDTDHKPKMSSSEEMAALLAASQAGQLLTRPSAEGDSAESQIYVLKAAARRRMATMLRNLCCVGSWEETQSLFLHPDFLPLVATAQASAHESGLVVFDLVGALRFFAVKVPEGQRAGLSALLTCPGVAPAPVHKMTVIEILTTVSRYTRVLRLSPTNIVHVHAEAARAVLAFARWPELRDALVAGGGARSVAELSVSTAAPPLILECLQMLGLLLETRFEFILEKSPRQTAQALLAAIARALRLIGDGGNEAELLVVVGTASALLSLVRARAPPSFDAVLLEAKAMRVLSAAVEREVFARIVPLHQVYAALAATEAGAQSLAALNAADAAAEAAEAEAVAAAAATEAANYAANAANRAKREREEEAPGGRPAKRARVAAVDEAAE